MSGKGNYEFILAFDVETSGIAFGCDDPSFNPHTNETYQAVSCGLIVVHAPTLKTIEELYVEIQWDGLSQWSTKAERVHGLSIDYLQTHGMSRADAVCEIGSLIVDYWGPGSPICLLGHNVATFDLFFLRRLMRSEGVELRFGSRHIDTSAIGAATFGTQTSDELFSAVGLPPRDNTKHNALDDAKSSLHVVRTVKTLWNEFVVPQIT